MYTSEDLIRTVKEAALNAVNASKPADILFGIVEQVNPLRVQIDNKLTIGTAQMVMTKTVSSSQTLAAGTKLVLVRMAGGQTFVAIDEVGGGTE